VKKQQSAFKIFIAVSAKKKVDDLWTEGNHLARILWVFVYLDS
jgi:hypothetical protein